jgi:hypothetical protein
MARRPSSPSSRPSPPAPAGQAMVRIGELVARGAAPDRVGREAERIAKEWAAEGEEGRERCQEVAEQLGEGLTAAEESAADIDRSEASAVKAGEATVRALRLARDAFAGGAAA